ncbi:MAG: 6-bladed beta-propeller [Lachnoclostridium sp.]|jgi:hypothetical protein|nr:6-bladed beta-propeller [Lachnoclostridium sp.]
MKNVYGLLLTAFLFLSLCNCKGGRDTQDGLPVRYLNTNADDLNYKRFIEEIGLVQLGIDDNYIIGGIDQLATYNDKWFVLDRKHRMALFVFDKNGKPVGQYNRLGRGPNEYFGIFGFDIDPDSGDIILLCARKLILLDEDLNPTRELVVNDIYERAAFHEDGVLLYSYTQSRVDYLSLEGGEAETVFEFEGDKDNAFTPNTNIFIRAKDALYFHTVEVDKLFRIDNKRFNAIATIDYDMKREAKSIYTNVGITTLSLKDRLMYSRPRIMSIIDRKGGLSLIFNNLLSCINVDSGGGLYENWQISSLMGSSDLMVCGDVLVGWTHAFHYDKDSFNQYHKYDGIPINHIDANPKEIEDNGNPILIFYKLRPDEF